MIHITIHFDKCDLKKATNEGLKCMLYLLVSDQQYERCALVKAEMDRRGISSKINPK